MFDVHVTPADPAATILDPQRGRPLPPEGAPVAWSPYWEGLRRTRDITVSDLLAEAEEPAVPPPKGKPRG